MTSSTCASPSERSHLARATLTPGQFSSASSGERATSTRLANLIASVHANESRRCHGFGGSQRGFGRATNWRNTPSVIMTQKSLDTPGTEPEGTTAKAEQTHEASSKRPIWSMQLNRVQSAMWRNDQGGQSRYSIAVFREYFSKREKQMKRDYYFDRDDLDDVRNLVQMAQDKILNIEGQERNGEVD